ncbi:TetR/AcrR family transcriptional regulator [Teredinibacter haidensis]|uniref:TetR/AcrR family transcriptional regulator n=1 Tax=Teredinibacter haidensis TaxID=2731755 RepID=UPI00094899A8|nr:TetR/AcrR family transcriptional regulator [Teredinibacter haidensis]
MRKTKEEAEKTYNALLDSAAALFILKGVTNTTLNDIAKNAGLTRGAVYWHFPNKDWVVMALWDRGALHVHQDMVTKLKELQREPKLEKFVKQMHNMFGLVNEDPSFTQAIKITMNCVEITEESSELQDYLNQNKNNLYGAIKTAITSLHAAGELTQSYTADLITNSLWVLLIGLVNIELDIHRPNEFTATRDTELFDLWLKGFIA